MTKEELEIKIAFIEKNIEWNKEVRAFDKKINKSIIFIIALVFVVILIANVNNKNVSVTDVLCISLFTVSTYNMLDKANTYKRDNENELRALEIELKHHKALLDKVSK
jgi:hypothetical protein